MKKNPWGLLLGVLVLVYSPTVVVAAEAIRLYFPPDWQDKTALAEEIAAKLSQDGGVKVKAQVAASYPEILDGFAKKEPVIVFVGSLVSTILHQRQLAHPILQGQNGRELYRGVLIVSALTKEEAATVIKMAGADIAYAKGASSGEISAKAATNGLANIAANSHADAMQALQSGKAKAAFVKNWWWEDHSKQYPEYQKRDVAGISDHLNPDYVLSVSATVPEADVAKLKKAIVDHAELFNMVRFKEVNDSVLRTTLDLLHRGKLDPLTYTW